AALSHLIAVTFVLKGEDVTLDIQKPDIQEGTTFAWRFKSRYNVLRLDNDKVFIFPNYRGRVEFSLEDYSLLLKNLTEADSGVYSALLIGEQDEKVRVSPVHLTVKPVSSSSDSCNVTVTCSSQDSSISSTLTCDGEDCSLEGGERSEVTASAASITVYLLNGSVICNHSNQVSWREDRMKIDALCWLHAGKTLTVMNISSIVLTSFFSVYFVICFIVSFHHQYSKLETLMQALLLSNGILIHFVVGCAFSLRRTVHIVTLVLAYAYVFFVCCIKNSVITYKT
uniref:Immunoglobulin subtype domain-containing protein n=1 Tax=Myripristis murdjan TaxID=586833 RepID=A0A667YRD7_9TELE